MKRKILLLAICTSVFVAAQDYMPSSNGEVVTHTYYRLSYLEDYEQAEWVYYLLTPQMHTGPISIDNDTYKIDPDVTTKSAQLKDYRGSKYHKGHLAPAADMKINTIAMQESFFMSNISPQHPKFNNGIWHKLEELVRSWATQNSIYIVTGGILKNGLEEIGPNGVDVPEHFYKIIYDPKNKKMIGFILPNQKSKKSLKNYVVSVDEIEEKTNIDFFPQLPNKIEKKLEASKKTSDWKF